MMNAIATNTRRTHMHRVVILLLLVGSLTERQVMNADESRNVSINAALNRPGKSFSSLGDLSQASDNKGQDMNIVVVTPPAQQLTTTTVANLRCEYRVDPVGVDALQPHLSWAMEGAVREQRQTAYRVLVAGNRAELDANNGTLWDSAKIESDQSVAVSYAGKELQSGRRYSWKVMAWDKDGQPLPWSPPATFGTGKLKPDDWRGKWIGANTDQKHQPVYLRREFDVAKPVTRATVFFCGLGWSELFIGGRRVGDYLMGPGPTTYDKRTQYLVFDVTDQFRQPGRTTLDVVLFDGWYALERDPWVHQLEKKPYVDKPKLLLDLHLEHADGTETVVSSDADWHWSFGPIRRSWICEQDCDFRVATGPWQPVALVTAPAGRLVAQREPPTRVVETIHPVSLTKTKDGWTFAFDREFTGFVTLRTTGPAGTMVKLQTHPAKLGPRNFSFLLKGDAVEEFAPRETYTAIAKVTVRGLTKPPVLADLTGCRVSGVGAAVSAFACSDETINWLHESARRTQANYVTFLPNDPTREFKAWTQDIQNMFWSAMYLFDSQAMYERWQSDMLDTQAADGNLPNVAPGPVFDPYNSPWWGGCGVWLPWELWQRTGDDRLLREGYDAMKRYVDFLSRQSHNGQQDWGLADWPAWESTPRPIVNTPAAYHFARIVSRTATMLGHNADADRYAQLADEIRDKFNARFLDTVTGIYGIPGSKCDVEGSGENVYPKLSHETWWPGDRPCTQTGQALPLALGIVPENVRPAAERALLREVAAHHNHLSTGFIGTPYLLAILADLAPAVGHALTTQRDFPSWYAMTKGAGCDQMMETWNGGQAFMPSLGGNIAAWNIEALAGVRPDPDGPGFKKIVIKPAIVGNLTWVKARFDSPYGRIVSHWRRDGKQLTLDITIPANTSATVHVPGEPPRQVGSGNHQFKTILP